MMANWDPGQYLKFAGERTRPSLDLIQRIELQQPRRIIDLGCGPGNSTEALRRRWPDSAIVGLDNSPQMIDTARRKYPQGNWVLGDAASWRAGEPFDLIFSNAMLQWLPDHTGVCRRLIEQVSPGGALAVQIPAHYDSALHREMIEVSKRAAWNNRMAAARVSQTHAPPALNYDTLQPLTARVDLWETTYYHILDGAEAILEWFRGTALRPFLEALPEQEERSRFEQELLDRYKVTYPKRANGKILFPFRRLFFVAYK